MTNFHQVVVDDDGHHEIDMTCKKNDLLIQKKLWLKNAQRKKNVLKIIPIKTISTR